MNDCPFYTFNHISYQDYESHRVSKAMNRTRFNPSPNECEQAYANISEHKSKRAQNDFHVKHENTNEPNSSSISHHDIAKETSRSNVIPQFHWYENRVDCIKRRIESVLMQRYNECSWKPSSMIFDYDGDVKKAIFISLIICLHSILRPVSQHIEWKIKFSSISILHTDIDFFFELNINPIDYENEELKTLSRYALEYIDSKVDRDYESKRILFMDINKTSNSIENSNETTSLDKEKQPSPRHKLKVWYYYKLTECIDIPLFKHILDTFIS